LLKYNPNIEHVYEKTVTNAECTSAKEIEPDLGALGYVAIGTSVAQMALQQVQLAWQYISRADWSTMGDPCNRSAI
jgi:hypothetical protein